MFGLSAPRLKLVEQVAVPGNRPAALPVVSLVVEALVLLLPEAKAESETVTEKYWATVSASVRSKRATSQKGSCKQGSRLGDKGSGAWAGTDCRRPCQVMLPLLHTPLALPMSLSLPLERNDQNVAVLQAAGGDPRAHAWAL